MPHISDDEYELIKQIENTIAEWKVNHDPVGNSVAAMLGQWPVWETLDETVRTALFDLMDRLDELRSTAASN